jgi:SpoVK/Ycf46/Vps4 family AAA+-type ATPase
VTASAEHIKAMVRSHASGDDAQFYAIALQVAARSARQGHQKAATELKELIDDARNKGRATSSVTSIAKPRGEIADLVTATFPETHLSDLVGPESVLSAIAQVVSEQRQRHHLESNGFDPIHRLLLEGPPGTGKTMTASVLATELSLPLLTIRLDAVLSKFLGETSSKLRVLFDGVAQQRAVYLFDEFDALGGHRAGNDVGEARRILNSFLVFLEQSSPESILVAATNHIELLDRALFRRFDIAISYELPNADETVRVLKKRLGSLGRGIKWPAIKSNQFGLSHAELVKAAEAAAKRSLLSKEALVTTEGLMAALNQRRESSGA